MAGQVVFEPQSELFEMFDYLTSKGYQLCNWDNKACNGDKKKLGRLSQVGVFSNDKVFKCKSFFSSKRFRYIECEIIMLSQQKYVITTFDNSDIERVKKLAIELADAFDAYIKINYSNTNETENENEWFDNED
ncbi:MAG: hypothetical protein Q7K43_03535 [Candidatus Woesearchaeota archaeon]|nr:hypothetical protein [Candidatus Woesearchaeota archaeon]